MLTGLFVPCETINGHYKQFTVSLKPFEIVRPKEKMNSMETFSVLFDKSAGPKWQLPKSTRKFFLKLCKRLCNDAKCPSIRSLSNFKV